jgi:hypothetical protein
MPLPARAVLNAVSGINLYFDSGEKNFYEAMPRFRDRFIEDWEAGRYLNVTALLQRAWTSPDEARKPGRIAPRA